MRMLPAMRHLIDTYFRAEEFVTVSEFDDLSLVQLIVERGAGAVDALPPSIRKKEKAVAETIERKEGALGHGKPGSCSRGNVCGVRPVCQLQL